jgi:BirA family biotin operon repressor/biotin-[acetyl-CoA-carboxylase] ligase
LLLLFLSVIPKGNLLVETPDQIDPATLNAALRNTPFAGRLHHFASIDSTNTYALEQARLGAPSGSFYLADEQTAGRGRSDHEWHSAASQGIYLSVLFRPAAEQPLPTADLVWIPLMTGLAAYEAIREVTALTPDLRLPNDILIESRKVAGILVEAQTESELVSAAVIGIGINLHQQSFPANLATPATSLDMETGRIVSRPQLLVALLQALYGELSVFSSTNREAALASIPDRIAAISTWVSGRRVDVHGPRMATGVTAGLDARGFLRLRTKDGLITITSGGLRAASS